VKGARRRLCGARACRFYPPRLVRLEVLQYLQFYPPRLVRLEVLQYLQRRLDDVRNMRLMALHHERPDVVSSALASAGGALEALRGVGLISDEEFESLRAGGTAPGYEGPGAVLSSLWRGPPVVPSVPAGSVIVRGRPRVGAAETAKTACDAVVEKPCKIGKHSSSLLQVCQLLSFEPRSERPRTPTRRERAVVAVRLFCDRRGGC
jgi:hypothetical protein